MNGTFGNILNGLIDIWKSIGITQKVSIILTALGALVVCGVVLYYGTRPEWQVLYAGLDQKTAAKVYDIVKDSGAEVKLTNGGKTIMVAGADVYKLRLQVASEGIETNAVGSGGYETIDGLQIGATEFQQQIAKQRAHQGELEKMINTIPGVLSSRVMLAVPQKSIYKKDRVPPSASVTLTLGAGRVLDPEAISCIRSIIASTVPGMIPGNVTIVDSNGQLLAKQKSNTADGFGVDSGSQLELQNKMERLLKEKAEAILRPIVGPENVEAHVACEMDFDVVDKVVESYDADNAVVLTEKIITEDMARNGAGISGRAGTRANTGAVDGSTQDEMTEVSISNPEEVKAPKAAMEQKKISERTFAVPKTVQKVATHAGKIKRITVGVAVSKKPDGSSWNLKDFQSLVSAAVGADIYKGNFDNANAEAVAPIVTVVETDFFRTEKAAPVMPLIDQVNYNYSKFWELPFTKPALGLLMLLTMYLVFRKYFRATTEESPETRQLNEVYSEELKQLGEVKEHEDVLPPVQAEAEEVANPVALDILQSKNASSPQVIAAIMENWLQQES